MPVLDAYTGETNGKDYLGCGGCGVELTGEAREALVDPGRTCVVDTSGGNGVTYRPDGSVVLGSGGRRITITEGERVLHQCPTTVDLKG